MNSVKISKKWVNKGWVETKTFYSKAFHRRHNGELQMVIQTPSRTAWRAIRYDSLNAISEETLHPTIVKSMMFLDN